MANKSSLGIKLLVTVVVLGAGLAGTVMFLRPVAKVAAVAGGPASSLVPGSVTVQAEGGVRELKSLYGGTVLKMENLDPGKRVKEGEVLVQIDTKELELDIDHIQSEYEYAKRKLEIGSQTANELQIASDALEFAERQLAANLESEVNVKKLRFAKAAIEQRLNLEKLGNEQTMTNFAESLKVKKLQLEKMTITAPAEVIISTVNIHKGDLIGPNTILATMIATTLTVEAKISEENFANIKVGQFASVKFLSYGDWYFKAKISKILPTADPETQRYLVYLDVEPEPGKPLKPGLTGETTITVDERQAKALVPRRALFGDFVYIVQEGRVKLQKVKKGYVSLTAAEILEGLQPGDQVIVDQLEQFHEGDRVRVEVVESLTVKK